MGLTAWRLIGRFKRQSERGFDPVKFPQEGSLALHFAACLVRDALRPSSSSSSSNGFEFCLGVQACQRTNKEINHRFEERKSNHSVNCGKVTVKPKAGFPTSKQWSNHCNFSANQKCRVPLVEAKIILRRPRMSESVLLVITWCQNQITFQVPTRNGFGRHKFWSTSWLPASTNSSWSAMPSFLVLRQLWFVS